MSTHLQEKEERILALLERLAQKNSKGIPIIVEGRKDVEALRALGVEEEFIEAKTAGKSFMEVVSEVEKWKTHEIVLLLDFDRRGREWTKRLKQHLEGMHMKPNVFFWEELLNIVGREVKDIEGLARYMQTLRRKIAGIA